jgi:DinB superfamily
LPPLQAQDKKPATLREVLLAELRSTHTTAEWFVPANTAVKGLTAEQANWTDGKGNHSVGQLAYHLVFWNQRNLAKLKGQNLDKFSGNNDETFTKFDSKTWNETVKQLDEVMSELEKWVETADEAKLKESAQVFTHISTHNAYHVGQNRARGPLVVILTKSTRVRPPPPSFGQCISVLCVSVPLW